MDELEEKSNSSSGRKAIFSDFDCPLCNANNPYDEGIRADEDVRCYYCGAEFRVSVNDAGKLKLKEK